MVRIAIDFILKYSHMFQDGTENECSCGNSGFGQYGLSVSCTQCFRNSKNFTCAPTGSVAVYRTFCKCMLDLSVDLNGFIRCRKEALGL